eukprot:TRINITY_DN1237_c0_g1_i1.p1 TRINITY_DN1237_c0_g1~~TRINITY_DN1237_c0_g1_i1.p1  ORF type:complete len:909 (-),score=84.20 TRINITY_DN1237_c0_g1_i1:860-3586(-)
MVQGRVLILFCIILHGIGLYLFTAGFFLTKYSINERSTCSHSASDSVDGCWSEIKYKKAVFVIIDALRYDFVTYENISSPAYWQNKLPIIRDLRRTFPDDSNLFKFVADPPTTTTQRLKALTTGGMPTFIDAADNFDPSQSISEDSWIYQMANNGLKVIFMGDDTWTQLYPINYFTKIHQYPSLIVKDIDTVDNGVIEHIFPYLQGSNTPDWDVIIAHFLGVDHVGHTYGSEHPLMAAKLRQMNEVLKNIVTNLPSDSIMFVFGDHGMTEDGNHGGASERETHAAMFTFTKPSNFREKFNKYLNPTNENQYGDDQHQFMLPSEMREISQIDLVPTISTLLGIPIPFGNLGLVIPELYLNMKLETFKAAIGELIQQSKVSNVPESSNQTSLLLKLHSLNRVLYVNINQIHDYILKYYHQTHQFSSHHIESLQSNYDKIEARIKSNGGIENFLSTTSSSHRSNLNETYSLYQEFIEYHTFIASLCRSLWTTFDVDSMTLGCIFMVLCIIFDSLFMFSPVYDAHLKVSDSFTFKIVKVFILLSSVAIKFLLKDISSDIIALFGFAVVLYLFFLLLRSGVLNIKTMLQRINHRKIQDSLPTVALFVLRLIILLSNSYIENEALSIYFLLMTTLLIRLFKEYTKYSRGEHSNVEYVFYMVLVLKQLSFSSITKNGSDHEITFNTFFIEVSVSYTLLFLFYSRTGLFQKQMKSNYQNIILTIGILQSIALLFVILNINHYILQCLKLAVSLSMVYILNSLVHENFADVSSLVKPKFQSWLFFRYFFVFVYWLSISFNLIGTIGDTRLLSWLFRVVTPNIVFLTDVIDFASAIIYLPPQQQSGYPYRVLISSILCKFLPSMMIIVGVNSPLMMFGFLSILLLLDGYIKDNSKDRDSFPIVVIYFMSIYMFYSTGT